MMADSIQISNPAYLGDAIRHVASSAANLWIWSNLIECHNPNPGKQTCYVYPREMQMQGPAEMKGKRVKITFEIEPDDS